MLRDIIRDSSWVVSTSVGGLSVLMDQQVGKENVSVGPLSTDTKAIAGGTTN